MAVSVGVTEELVCSVCLEIFHEPVLLPCAHTFCKQCLVNLHERRRNQIRQQAGNQAPATVGDFLSCPQCRQEVRLPGDGVEGFPRNTTLANIILRIQDEKKMKKVVCEVCDETPPREASKTCADCSVTYCDPCLRQLHPMRGAFKYHVIKDPLAPITAERCSSPIISERSLRFSPIRDMHFTDGAESSEETGANQDQVDKLRRSIRSKKRELNTVLKSVQDLLKLTEEETEEKMKEVRSLCRSISEAVNEREAAMLTTCSQQRHEAVKQGLALSSDVRAQIAALDLVEDQLGDVTTMYLHTGHDVTNELAALDERVNDIPTRTLGLRVKVIPRQPRLANFTYMDMISCLDFVHESKLACPVFLEVVSRPVARGPAILDVKWRPMTDVIKFRLSATRRDSQGVEQATSVEVIGDVLSYSLPLACTDTEYIVSLLATSKSGEKHPQAVKNIHTLPYVTCLFPKFSPSTCHKRIAVSAGYDEIVHRKCKLASLHDACPTTGYRRLELLEGAATDGPLPNIPHLYWEQVIHFHVFGQLADSKLVCDLGICKQGCEDSFAPLCDNFKAYCCYLVKRQHRIILEFWNGPNRDVHPRSIPVVNLEQENEKTLRLGFYYDVESRIFAIVSPGNNAILTQYHVKFTGVVPIAGLYCFDQVFALVRFIEPQKVPRILSKLMRN